MRLPRELRRRREVLAAGGAAMAGLVAAATAGNPAPGPARVETWEQEHCPGCGLPVAFLPGQHANVCGHCRTPVEH